MPKIYRSMREEDDRPAVRPKADGLGARPDVDIPVNEAGQVQPSQGGMSVSPSLRDLPARLVPVRMHPIVPGAVGKDVLCIWHHGSGAFEAGSVTADLALRPDPLNERHGFVEPSRVITLEDYQAALAATRDQWQKEEP